MIGSIAWIILAAGQGIPDAPESETHAEAILLWVTICLALAVVGMFWWVQRVHSGHKEAWRKQAEDHAASIRAQEQAYAQALKDQADRDQTHREQVSDRLFGILEAATSSREKNTAAVETLIAEYRRGRPSG